MRHITSPSTHLAKILVTLGLTLASSLSTHAQPSAFFSAGDLLRSWNEGEGKPGRVFTLGYVAGVADFTGGMLFCPGKGASVGQVTEAAMAAIEKNPGLHKSSADMAVSAVLVKLYPCEEKTKTLSGSDRNRL